jgi:hypothetical protein
MWASDKGLRRPTDLAVSRGNPAKAILVPFAKRLPAQRGYANERLGWVAKHKIADIVRLMILHRRGYCRANAPLPPTRLGRIGNRQRSRYNIE